MLSRPVKILIGLLVAAGAVAFWSTWHANREPAGVPDDVVPAGRWTRLPTTSGEARDDLAAVLSLPYLEGKVEAEGLTGILAYDPDRALEGFNLYCSGHAPEAILMDMNGRPLHRWRMPFEEAFPELAPNQESAFFRRVVLLPNGELLALFQGKGLVKLDRRSRLVWAKPIAAFNDLWVDRGGGILVLVKEARVIPAIAPDEPVLEDFVVELTRDGEEVGRLSLLALFRQPPWHELLRGMKRRGDILHSNTLTRLDGSAGHQAFARGNLLVSLREVDIVASIDPRIPEVVWAQTGPWHLQHEPVALADGRVLLFDNQGGPGGAARVVEIEPSDGEIVWSWGEAPGQEIYSPEAGTVARLRNGNTLITASESGRAIEIDSRGEIVWEFANPHRAGPRDRLVATLWEMLRVDSAEVDWLGAGMRRDRG